MLKMSWKKYRTRPIDYQTWVDVLVLKTKLDLPYTSLTIVLPLFVTGLVLSAIVNFQFTYLTSPPIYLGIFGIALVTSVIGYASRFFHESYEGLRPCFLVSDKDYTNTVQKWFLRFVSKKGTFKIWLLFLSLSTLIAYISFYNEDILTTFGIVSLRPKLFSDAWFLPEGKFVKALIIGVYGAAIALPLGTAFRLLLLNYSFLRDLEKFPVIPLSEIIKLRLRPITNLYILVSATWFIGVGTFGYLLFESPDLIAALILFIFSLLGLVTFVIPQAIYRKFLISSNRLSSQWILASFYSKFDVKLSERDEIHYNILNKKIGLDLADIEDLSGFIQASNNPSFWVYNLPEVLLFVLSQVVAYGSLFF